MTTIDLPAYTIVREGREYLGIWYRSLREAERDAIPGDFILYVKGIDEVPA